MFSRRRAPHDADEVEERLAAAEDALDENDPRTALRHSDAALDAARRLDGATPLVVLALTTRAAALTDLGLFADALAAAGEACGIDPEQAAAWHERGIALYRLGRFAEAAGAFRSVSELAADAAESWHALGRCAVWLEDMQAARDAFARAATLDPDEYVVPLRIAAGEFDRVAGDVWASIPPRFRAMLDNTMVVVEPLPDLEDVERGFDPDTLGVYEGSTALHTGAGPERIVLFQRNHENVCASLGALREEIRRTILHEVGHHFGMEEHELPY